MQLCHDGLVADCFTLWHLLIVLLAYYVRLTLLIVLAYISLDSDYMRQS